MVFAHPADYNTRYAGIVRKVADRLLAPPPEKQMTHRTDRRSFLKGTGIGLALPMFESLPCTSAAQTSATSAAPERLVCAGTWLGFHQPDFFPSQTGSDYTTPQVLKSVHSFRDEMTIFSGLDHRGRNGHEGWRAWLTGSAAGSVSLDQVVAARIGDRTRFASLQVTCGRVPKDAKISFTKEGVPLPMIGRPSVLYGTLFRSDSDKDRLEYLLSGNQSVLDGVLEEAVSLERRLPVRDREKLGEYLASVRDVEKKLQKNKRWLDRPVPKIEYPLPEFDPVSPDQSLECETIMYDLMALALTTDSTRVLTFLIPGWSQVFTIDGRTLSTGYHGLSHHGNDPEKIAEYNLVGIEHVQRFARFLRRLRSFRDAHGRPLLDSTAVLFGSGMGNTNTHDNTKLPTLLAGGGFRHGQHHRIERNAAGSKLLGDLYLTLLRQFGIEADQFANAGCNMNEYLL